MQRRDPAGLHGLSLEETGERFEVTDLSLGVPYQQHAEHLAFGQLQVAELGGQKSGDTLGAGGAIQTELGAGKGAAPEVPITRRPGVAA